MTGVFTAKIAKMYLVKKTSKCLIFAVFVAYLIFLYLSPHEPSRAQILFEARLFIHPSHGRAIEAHDTKGRVGVEAVVD